MVKECVREECSVKFDTFDKRKKYCSRSCASMVNNTLSPKRQPQGRCKTCDKAISSNRTYCSKGCHPNRELLVKCLDCDADREVGTHGRCREHYNEYMKTYMLDRYYRRRNEFIVSRGGICESCSSDDRLEIDHIDRKTKSFDIGKALSGWSEDRIQRELAKCQVLCYTCHKEKTSSELSVGHGEGKTGRKNCYCSLCGPLKAANMRRYRKNKK